MIRVRMSGVVAALVGFTSSFAIVLAGLQAVGASADQAASGLLVLCVAQAVGAIWFARRYRMPITFAWSTAGAALLLSTGETSGSWPAAVGAFIVAGVLVMLTGLWSPLARAVGAIPPAIAQAMLAGVILPLCLEPFIALPTSPLTVAPVLVAWILGARFWPLLAVPVAFVIAAVVIGVVLVTESVAIDPASLVPMVTLTAPAFDPITILSVGIPLYLVTMATQNVPGAAVMASFGYRLPWRPAMLFTGAASAIGAVAGGHAVSVAAISAALAASPDVHPDTDRRWPAATWVGFSYLAIAALSAALATLVLLGPVEVVQAVAGVALLGTLGNALGAASADADTRVASVLTIVIASSGVAFFGIGAAFWALVVGLATRALLSPRRTKEPLATQ